MNWTTYKLKLPDEATLDVVFPVGEDGPTYDPHTVCIVKLGTLYEGGTYDEQGEVIEPPIALPGYHADIRLRIPLPTELESYVVEPASPKHRFAGESN